MDRSPRLEQNRSPRPPPPPSEATLNVEARGVSSGAAESGSSSGGRPLSDQRQLEEMAEMEESIDALRLIVAKQGAQLRRQEALIEELLARVGALELGDGSFQ